MRVQVILLLIGAWFPLVVTIGTLWFLIRLLSVPAGPDIPWRWAWRSLAIGVLSIGLLWLRNALVVSGMSPERSWFIEWLLNLPLRVALSTIAASGFFGCAFYCYQIFKPRQPPLPIPVAQIVMNWRGIIISWNAAATELLGWTEEEAVEQELAALIIPADFMIPMNGEVIAARDLHRQGLQRFRETGASPILDTRFPTKALHKDGRQLDVEVRVNEHLTPLGRTFLGQIVPISKVIV